MAVSVPPTGGAGGKHGREGRGDRTAVYLWGAGGVHGLSVLSAGGVGSVAGTELRGWDSRPRQREGRGRVKGAGGRSETHRPPGRGKGSTG